MEFSIIIFYFFFEPFPKSKYILEMESIDGSLVTFFSGISPYRPMCLPECEITLHPASLLLDDCSPNVNGRTDLNE